MLLIKKLYPSDSSFRSIDFESGINIICGDKSTKTNKQNGVGKSLAVELINFCFFKKDIESKVIDIPDKYLARNVFVNLEFQFQSKSYTISRNKKNDIYITSDNKKLKYTLDDARDYLASILGLSRYALSARNYINFMIKEEDYNYRTFVHLYKSSYIELLKIHFYFFNMSIEWLKELNEIFQTIDLATRNTINLNKNLMLQDLTVSKLKAINNQNNVFLKQIELGLDYDQLTENIANHLDEYRLIESKISELLNKKNQLESILKEVEAFQQSFDDEQVSDKDISSIFNYYKEGLGDLVKKDIESVKAFNKQLLEYKQEMLNPKKEGIRKEIKEIDEKLNMLSTTIKEKFPDLVNQTSSSLVKNFQIFQKRFEEFKKYDDLINRSAELEETKKQSKLRFNTIYKEIENAKDMITEKINSFRTTFNTVHEGIMKNSMSVFEINTKEICKKESFFSFNIYIDGKGSKGVNQMIAVIYDIALLLNEFTKERHLGCIIHDNLIFGTVDKDSSINTINFLASLPKDTFQYIATVNKDDYEYDDLSKNFTVDPKTFERIRLTKENPLFPDWKLNIE